MKLRHYFQMIMTIIVTILSPKISSSEEQKEQNGGYKLNCRPQDSTDLAFDDDVYLCVHFIESKRKAIFKIKVDEYSVISVKNSFSTLMKGGVYDQKIVAQIGTEYTSFPSVSKTVI